MRTWLRNKLGGAPAYPGAVLSGLNLVDEFDRVAYALLLPEIAADFNASATTAGLLFVPQLLLAFVLPVSLGYLGDRYNRVRLTIIAAAAWTVMSFASGLAPSFFVLGAIRFLSQIAKAANVVQLSLISDWYPSKGRGFVLAGWNGANRVGEALGLLAAGFIGQALGWRMSFLLLAIPSVALLLAMLRVREPERGLVDAQEAGIDSVPQLSSLGPIRAARLMLRNPTFKRLCWSTALSFGAVTGAGIAMGFYFTAVFDLESGVRGVIGTIPLVLGVVTFFIGGAYGQRRLAANDGAALVRFTVFTMGVTAAGFVGLAFAPNVVVAVVVSTVSNVVAGLSLIPLQLLLSKLVAPNIRSQAFGVFFLFMFALTPLTLPIGLSIGDRIGFRVAILAFVPLFLLGAAVMWSASRTVDRDMERARRVTVAEIEARRLRAEGNVPNVLEVRGLDAGYGNVQILFGVDFHVAPGEIVALLGTNGAGKSTLLKAISGLLTPTSGYVFLDGEDITGLDAEITASRGVIQVPGGRGVFPGLTVARNLELGAFLHWRDPDYVAESRKQVLELFPRLAERMDQPAGTLSGGEQQMLTLAQAFVSKPRILMIDELSLGLAPIVVQELLVAVEEMNKRGTTMVLVEQSFNIAMTLAHRAYFLEKGEVRFEGATADLIGRTDLLRSVFLEGATAGAGV